MKPLRPSSSSSSSSSSTASIVENSFMAVPTWNDGLRRSIVFPHILGFSSGVGDSKVRQMAAVSDDYDGSDGKPSEFKRGDKILVEVMNFGKLGASVKVVGKGGLDEEEGNAMGRPQQQAQVLGRGLILQKEIHYFRLARGGIDVVRGEILPAYVEHIREDHKIDVSLRPPGGMAKSRDVSSTILDLLLQSNEGTLNVGDRSSPEQINALLPGTSKLAFKKAVSALYKQKKITIQPTSISLVR